MLDSLKESACERMAGKGASGVRAAEVMLHSFVNFVTQGYKGTVGSSREFRHLMTNEEVEGLSSNSSSELRR